LNEVFKMPWDDRLKEQVKRDWENYKKKRLDLSTAQNDLRLDLAGEFLYVEAVSSASATATVKLNRDKNDAITLSHQTKIRTVFTTLYITHAAQAGEWIDIIIGVDFSKTDPQLADPGTAQPVIEITNIAADTNTIGAAAIATVVVIKADPQNVDIAWIDFTTPAVQDACFPLEPGDSLTARIDNVNQVNVNFEVANDQVWIVNQV